MYDELHSIHSRGESHGRTNHPRRGERQRINESEGAAQHCLPGWMKDCLSIFLQHLAKSRRMVYLTAMGPCPIHYRDSLRWSKLSHTYTYCFPLGYEKGVLLFFFPSSKKPVLLCLPFWISLFLPCLFSQSRWVKWGYHRENNLPTFLWQTAWQRYTCNQMHALL